MKYFPFILITLLSFTSCAQTQSADKPKEQMDLEQWREEAQTNIRLLPKYGYAEKSDGQKEADKDFVTATMQSYNSKKAASDHVIQMGFKYLYSGNIKTAMYRFNQAFLLDSTNTDIYWGYGAVYFSLNDVEDAQQQYEQGLAVNPDNTHLLTDYATCFISKYHEVIDNDEKMANAYVDTAIEYLTKSYKLDKTDANTTFKLSTCYLRKKDCANARKYYEACKANGGQPITEEYTQALNDFCTKQ